MRLVQLQHATQGRRTALVDNEDLRLIDKSFPTLYSLIWEALNQDRRIRELVGNNLGTERLSYDSIYSGADPWSLLPSFDHPHDKSKCLITGTGLTHKVSAENRSAMHQGASDSMRMYLWGEEGGKPPEGEIGVQPEWFYKGDGSQLRGHLADLEVPYYALDGGEESEIAGVYLIDQEGQAVRLGLTIGNEFSDHVMEQKNYLYLAPSKLRPCAIGPELVLGADFSEISGSVHLGRKGHTLWDKQILTGEKHITHSLRNLEYHHFKYPQHRVPGQVHIHFFGTYGLSFSEGIKLQDGDEISISMKGFGRPLKNTVRFQKPPEKFPEVRELV